ncbi:hypothetical protein NE865_03395 [Phthorimaea operculella]|nr:hypothetical protein NE865_03395 [Phthorimaea operculella]
MEIAQINQLIKSQETDYYEIKQLLTNMKKDSPTRKTDQYIAGKRAKLTEIFERTKTNHARLEEQEVLSTHRYMTTNYFGHIENQYKEAMKYLLQCEQNQQLLNQLYEPTYMEDDPEHNYLPKLFIQIFRINQMQKKLQQTNETILQNKPVWYLESLLTNLQKQWREIEETHVLILMESSTFEHKYFTDNLYETVQNEYESVTEYLFAKMSENKPIEETPYRSNRLPKIILPVFTGSYESWNNFHDLFTKIIHNDRSLTATEKMQYLKTHVQGDAAKLIKHLCVSEANYQTAWSLLTRRYENKRLIITKHLDNILEMTPIKRCSAHNLRNLHDTINENLEALKCQDIDISTWDPILARILSKKWDSETDEKYENQLDEPNKLQKFSDMMKFLEKRFKCLETTMSSKDDRQTNNKPKLEQKPACKNYNSACWFCNSNEHNVYTCPAFKALSLQERAKAVSEKRICKNCLAHDSSLKCFCTKLCGYCSKQGHHSLLHQENYKKTNTLPQKRFNYSGHWKQDEPKNHPPPKSGTKPNNQVSSNTSSTTTKPKTQTMALLATAIVRTTALDGSWHLLRALIDPGSEASFCTEEVAQLLALPRTKIQTDVTGIADEKPKTSNYTIDATLLPRFPSEYKLPVTLHILPKLTGPLPKTDIPQIQEQSLENKLIADPTYYKRDL